MGDINFVADPGNQPEKKDDTGEEQIRWSEAERQAPKPGLLSFLSGKKSSIPGSRDEALRLIKSYVKEKESTKIDSAASPVLPAKPAKRAGGILEMKPHDEASEASPKATPVQPAFAATLKQKDGLAIFFKKFLDRSNKKIDNGHILATDLISGEVMTVFDWRKNIPVFIFWLLLAGLIIVGCYQGLVVWEEKKVAEANTNTEKFQSLRIQVSQEEKGVDEILGLQKKLEVIKKLLDRHIYWTNFLVFLERNTLASVSFNGFAGDTGGMYALSGTAKDFKALADQLITFKADKMVIRVGSRGGTASVDQNGNGTISFDLELSVKKELFNKEVTP